MTHDDYHQRTADEEAEKARVALVLKEAEYAAIDWIENTPRETLQRLLDTGKTQWPCHEVRPGHSFCMAHLIEEWFDFLDRCEKERQAEEEAAAIRRAACPSWGTW